MSEPTRNLLAALEWRYSTKVYDPAKKIPIETWAALEKSLVLTPSSYGLQPYKFFVIQDPAKRAQLLAHSWNQKQVVDASHFVVFTARTGITETDVDRFINRAVEVRKLPADALTGYRKVIVRDLVDGPRKQVAHEWATLQTYIALGNLMTSAALLSVDTGAMEGIVSAEYDKVLGLENSGYTTVVACALGYRSMNDKYAGAAKVRFETRELVQYI
ncbi:MAG TPA: NAD(P)H-dependent oxidoreductase [Verrucomicrobiae bacterium]